MFYVGLIRYTVNNIYLKEEIEIVGLHQVQGRIRIKTLSLFPQFFFSPSTFSEFKIQTMNAPSQ